MATQSRGHGTQPEIFFVMVCSFWEWEHASTTLTERAAPANRLGHADSIGNPRPAFLGAAFRNSGWGLYAESVVSQSPGSLACERTLGTPHGDVMYSEGVQSIPLVPLIPFQ